MRHFYGVNDKPLTPQEIEDLKSVKEDATKSGEVVIKTEADEAA